jgi:metal-responsive CopG/Arc/MetJ family transcriptional regulator
MAARITVSLPAELVERIDAEAERAGVSRSSVIREASSAYLSSAAKRQEAARRQRAGKALMAFLDEHDALPVADERPVLEILREIRGPLPSAPEEPVTRP